MGLFKRISDIISANLNDMADGLEDPEKMLKQAVREMEQSINVAMQETAKVLANEKLLGKELASNQQQLLADKAQGRAQVKGADADVDETSRQRTARKGIYDRGRPR